MQTDFDRFKVVEVKDRHGNFLYRTTVEKPADKKKNKLIIETCDRMTCNITPEEYYSKSDCVKNRKQRRNFTEREILEIRSLRANGVKIKEVAKLYNTGSRTVSQIANRKVYANIEGDL